VGGTLPGVDLPTLGVRLGAMTRPDAAHVASPAELQERLEAERRCEPFLLYRDAGGQRIVPLGSVSGRFSVGRDDGMDLTLDDDQVSLLHAELEPIGGQWTVVDDGLSRNGTFLNGERTSGRSRLRDGDELRFGETVVVFRDPVVGEAGETASAPDGPPVERLTESQRKILIALCRPFRDGSPYATPATNRQIADEVFLSVDAVKGHLRTLFERFELGDVPQNQKRVRLVELTLKSGLISIRDLS
jgi:pSer/pThr/pTyr-binding forkhead associated (FHA) protein